MRRVMDYFKLDYDHTELKYKDMLAQAREKCFSNQKEDNPDC